MSDDARAKVDPPPALAGSGPKVNADKLQFEALVTFARVDFWCFVELMFAVLYPGQKLVYAGYLELIATLLMRVGQRKFRNVIINLPPRHMKSALASILYPAWRLGCDPTVKFICISYGDDLAHDLSAQTRKVMRSPLYKLIFPGGRLHGPGEIVRREPMHDQNHGALAWIVEARVDGAVGPVAQLLLYPFGQRVLGLDWIVDDDLVGAEAGDVAADGRGVAVSAHGGADVVDGALIDCRPSIRGGRAGPSGR